jgi:hypothetical protein
MGCDVEWAQPSQTIISGGRWRRSAAGSVLPPGNNGDDSEKSTEDDTGANTAAGADGADDGDDGTACADKYGAAGADDCADSAARARAQLHCSPAPPTPPPSPEERQLMRRTITSHYSACLPTSATLQPGRPKHGVKWISANSRSPLTLSLPSVLLGPIWKSP